MGRKIGSMLRGPDLVSLVAMGGIGKEVTMCIVVLGPFFCFLEVGLGGISLDGFDCQWRVEVTCLYCC